MGRIIDRAFAFLLLFTIFAFAAINLAYYGGLVGRGEAVDYRRGEASATPGAGSEEGGADERAERDDSAALPGRFVPSQGRRHLRERYPNEDRVEFCPADEVRDDCYASNPPSSGLHLGVQTGVEVDGETMRIPPDAGIYDVAVPREAIPHIQEHAGVYAGYNCESAACEAAAERLRDVVERELNSGARVVLSPDPDLEADTIGLASWTRVDVFAAAAWDEQRVVRFIRAHSCRFDPERFCS